jgi:hypothetical protein
MDEMEMSINLKAVKSAWLFGILFLLIWVVYDWIKTDRLNVAFILMTSQLIIYWIVTLFFKWKLGKDEK